MSKRIDRLVSCYLDIEAKSAKDAGMMAYMARSMVMATLPHSKPLENVFTRKNGNLTLTMIGNPKFGLPYGSLPRLILAWLTREAKIKNTPELKLGKTFASFLYTLKMTRSGGSRGDATRVRQQMLKLLSTHISCTYHDEALGVCRSDQFVFTKSFSLWWTPLDDDLDIIKKESTIILAKDFFEEITDRPVPIDFRMLNALRRSPLQIDIYVWLTYRTSYLKRESFVSWEQLMNQFGSNYARTGQGKRDFKREFSKALHVVQTMYPEAGVERQNAGVMLKPGKTHIKKTQLTEVH